MKLATLLTMGTVAVLSTIAAASVPHLINFQGVLKDANGNSVADGTYPIKFEIFNSVGPGGGCLWLENQSVTTQGGLFSVVLGSNSQGIPDSVFSDSARWLAITVGYDPAISPRQRLVSVGYSYRVSSVDGALGGNILTKVSIGPGNTNSGLQAFVAGKNNVASGEYSTVSGGIFDTASSIYSTVGGGYRNTASGDVATINGGQVNTASGHQSTVGGGQFNAATGFMATVGGGEANVAGGNGSTVGGGQINHVSADGATVGGGEGNMASGVAATAGGGSNNIASGIVATVGGGSGNIASGIKSTVSGGAANKARGQYSVVSGGGGEFSVDSNLAFGDWAVIPGGRANLALGNYSFSAGRRAKANYAGNFVWADSTDADFASTSTNQFLIRASGGVGIGTNSPNSRLQVNGPIATAVTTAIFSGGNGNFNINDSHSILFIRADENSPSSFTVTLPAPTDLAGRQYTIKRIDASSAFVTIQSTIGLIDGTSTKTLNGQYKYLVLVSDGDSWFIVANN